MFQLESEVKGFGSALFKTRKFDFVKKFQK